MNRLISCFPILTIVNGDTGAILGEHQTNGPSNTSGAAGNERVESYEKNVPMKRRGEDKDIAHAVAFLASDLANFITGVYLPVCGGNVMPRI